MGEWNAQPVFAGTHETEKREWREGIADGFECWSVGCQENLLTQLGNLEIPVLWVVGKRDAKFLKIGRKAVATLPKGSLRIISGAGHRVMWDQREQFEELVRTFVKESIGNSESTN